MTTTTPKFDLQAMGIEGDAYEFFVEGGVDLLSDAQRFPVVLEQPAYWITRIGAAEFEASAVFHAARLERLTLADMTERNGYWSTGTNLNGIYVDLFITVDGEQMPIYKFLRLLTAQINKLDPDFMSDDEFIARAHKPGVNFPFLPPEINADREQREKFRSWTMSTTQLGADFEQSKLHFDWWMSQGASNTVPDDAVDWMIKFAANKQPGLDVVSFEIGRMDRSQSQKNQGFVDLITAVQENWQRVILLRKERKALKIQRDVLKTESEAKPKDDKLKAKIADLDLRLVAINRMAASRTTSIGGAQRRLVMVDGQTGFTETDIIDPTTVPCGRLTVVGNDGEEHAMNFWRNNQMAGAPEPVQLPEGVVSSDLDDDPDDKEPF